MVADVIGPNFFQNGAGIAVTMNEVRYRTMRLFVEKIRKHGCPEHLVPAFVPLPMNLRKDWIF